MNRVAPNVRVRFVRWESQSHDSIVSLIELLDNDEHNRLGLITDAGRRFEYIVSHAMLRLMLCSSSGVAPREFRFNRPGLGKPILTAPSHLSGLDFSISHTAGCAACAVGVGIAVGVDVELAHENRELDPAARRLFDQPEYEIWRRLTEDEATGLFYTNWTWKEGFAKATGKGVGTAMVALKIDVADLNNPVLRSFPGSDLSWLILSLKPSRDCWLGLAAGTRGKNVPIYSIEEMTMEELVLEYRRSKHG